MKRPRRLFSRRTQDNETTTELFRVLKAVRVTVIFRQYFVDNFLTMGKRTAVTLRRRP